MSTLFAEAPVGLMALAVVLIFVGLFGTVFAGRVVREQAQAQGGSAAGSYYLKMTLLMVVGLACFFAGVFLALSYR
jgi:hypothetical protein